MTIQFYAYQTVNLSPAGLIPIINEWLHTGSQLATGNSGAYDVTSGDFKVHFQFQSHTNDLTTSGPFGSVLTGGTVSSIELDVATGPLFIINGLSLPAVQIVGDFFAADVADALALIFTGHDIMSSISPGGDYLPSYARFDQVYPSRNVTTVGDHGNDTFHFYPHMVGHAKISKFITHGPKHDVIELLKGHPFHNFQELLAHTHGGAQGVVIKLDAHDTITLTDQHSKASLHAYDFHFA
jgi:hypothetical protein